MGVVTHLKLRHFRNYRQLDVVFPPGLSIITGGNGQGKTTVLEAIHYLAILRSFRTRKVVELCQWGADFFYLEACVQDLHERAFDKKLQVSYGDRRRLCINDKAIASAADFINPFLCVPFVPEDINLVKGSPGERRRFLDILLTQLQPQYLTGLVRFHSALKSRNAILKKWDRYGPAAIAGYDAVVAENGAVICQIRRQLVTLFSETLSTICAHLFPLDSNPEIEVKYCSPLLSGTENSMSTADLASKYLEQLRRDIDKDRCLGMTRVGPHRDDMMIMLNDKLVGIFASEGQCRLISIAMRLAAVEMIKKMEEKRGVVMLVDDVLGELDSERREAFFNFFNRADQIFLACTDVMPRLTVKADGCFKVRDGEIFEISDMVAK